MQLTSLSLALTRAGFQSVAAFSPLSLFAASEPGVWYDPSDMSTMFQDAAGTTPVTAVEQPVGRILDKSGRGNHATQVTATSRPVLSARVNLLTKTEQFDDAVWLKSNILPFGGGSIANTTETLDPIGGNASDKIVPNTANGTHKLTYTYSVATSSSLVFSAYVKSAGYNFIALNEQAQTGSSSTIIDLTTGIGATPVGNGWYRISWTFNIPGSPKIICIVPLPVSGVNPNNYAWTGDGTSGIYIWGASLVPADQADLPYQRVNTATDYDTAGFPHYLRFDGVDDWLVTPTITPGIDKVQVFAGVRKQINYLGSEFGILLEFSPNVDSGANSGVFRIIANGTSGFNLGYNFDSRGTLQAAANLSFAQSPAPQTLISSGLGDISGDSAILRVNGAQAASSTADQGQGNYLAYQLYIGRRLGTTLLFNGNLYGLIVRFGANLQTATIASTETWLNQRTGAY